MYAVGAHLPEKKASDGLRLVRLPAQTQLRRLGGTSSKHHLSAWTTFTLSKCKSLSSLLFRHLSLYCVPWWPTFRVSLSFWSVSVQVKTSWLEAKTWASMRNRSTLNFQVWTCVSFRHSWLTLSFRQASFGGRSCAVYKQRRRDSESGGVIQSTYCSVLRRNKPGRQCMTLQLPGNYEFDWEHVIGIRDWRKFMHRHVPNEPYHWD